MVCKLRCDTTKLRKWRFFLLNTDRSISFNDELDLCACVKLELVEVLCRTSLAGGAVSSEKATEEPAWLQKLVNDRAC